MGKALMPYHGGKARQAHWIAEELNKCPQASADGQGESMKALMCFKHECEKIPYGNQGRFVCKKCKKERNDDYLERERENINRRANERYFRNKDRICAYQRKFRQDNIKRMREKDRIRRTTENWKKSHRVYSTKWAREHPEVRKKWLSKPANKLASNMRISLRKGLIGFIKTNHTFDLIGKNPQDLMAYFMLIKKDPKIVPENYGSYWHVDHIVPLSWFDHSDPQQVECCWHWSNLQPLEGKANSSKGNKVCG